MMDKANINGCTIAYEDRGTGEVLVLLHGFCGSSAYWDRILPLLSSSYRLIIPDLRGHGASSSPNGAYTIEQMADDVVGLMEYLNVPQYTLLGHSMGGYIALSIAQRYSSRLKGYGLVHSTAYPDSEEAKEKRLKAVSTIQSSGITDFIDGLIPGLFAPNHVESMKEAVTAAMQIGYRTPPQGACGAALAMRERVDRRDVMTALPIPVLLVAGEHDQVVPLERTFTADGPHVFKSVIKGAGHMSMYEAPEQLASVIIDFLREIHG